MTPVEIYDSIFVKRDDECFSPPAPPFSKCRGLILHLTRLQSEGVKTVGYTETSISMAGWGVAWACKELGLRAVIFDPQYKITPELLKHHRIFWGQLEATIIPIKAGMAKVNYHISKKILYERFDNAVMLPLGLPLDETIEATEEELIKTFSQLDKINSIVVCVGSGTILTGIYKGLHSLREDFTLYGVLSRKGNVAQKRQKICKRAGIVDSGLFGSKVKLKLIDQGWEYTERSNVDCPFPCHPYYDLKAWEWLIQHKNEIEKPILFWNIGRDFVNL